MDLLWLNGDVLRNAGDLLETYNAKIFAVPRFLATCTGTDKKILAQDDVRLFRTEAEQHRAVVDRKRNPDAIFVNFTNIGLTMSLILLMNIYHLVYTGLSLQGKQGSPHSSVNTKGVKDPSLRESSWG